MPTDKPAPIKTLTDQQIGQLRQAFDVFDKNGDGKISFEEMKQVREEVTNSPQTDAEVLAAMKELDTDGDGFVTFNEFLSVMTVKLNSEPKATSPSRSASSPAPTASAAASAAARPSFVRQASSQMLGNNVQGGRYHVGGEVGVFTVATRLCWDCIWAAGWVALYAYMLYLYKHYKDTPCEENLTTYCLAAGIVGIIGAAINCCQIAANFLLFRDEDPMNPQLDHPFRNLVKTWNNLSGCTSLGILITGSVWVFGMNRSNHYCPSELYNFVWGFILALWCCIALVFCLVCCIFACSIISGQGNPGLGGVYQFRVRV